MSNPMSEYRSSKILIRAFVDRKNACYVLVSSQPVDTPDRFALRIGT